MTESIQPTNRAARRANRTVRMPEWQVRHLQRLERGFTPAIMARSMDATPPEEVVQGFMQQARHAWRVLCTAGHTPQEQQDAWAYLAKLIAITCERATQIAQANPAEQDQIDMMVITINLATNALERMHHRAQEHGSHAPDAIGLQQIPEALDLHEQILRLSSPLQMQRAVDSVDRKRGNIF